MYPSPITFYKLILVCMSFVLLTEIKFCVIHFYSYIGSMTYVSKFFDSSRFTRCFSFDSLMLFNTFLCGFILAFLLATLEFKFFVIYLVLLLRELSFFFYFQIKRSIFWMMVFLSVLHI